LSIRAEIITYHQSIKYAIASIGYTKKVKMRLKSC